MLSNLNHQVDRIFVFRNLNRSIIIDKDNFIIFDYILIIIHVIDTLPVCILVFRGKRKKCFSSKIQYVKFIVVMTNMLFR